MESCFYVYILRCEDGSLYTGIAKNLQRRFNEHLSRGKSCAKYTLSHHAEKIEAAWWTSSRKDACFLEYHIKNDLTKPQKEALITDPDELPRFIKKEFNRLNFYPVYTKGNAMKSIVENQIFDEERALYNLTDARVLNCKFEGPADGESALKESENIVVENCSFSLRYPFWHSEKFRLIDSSMDENTRAPIWYAKDGIIKNTTISGVKCLRECDNISLDGVEAVSPEFGWRCRDINFENCRITSEYFLFEARNIKINDLKMQGKYSFQYIENLTVENSVLDTKDAFWHTKNATVKNCTVKGEYLGWYSENLTLINCKISGTQPLCYCKGLKLINCTMDGADFAFEYSEVEADIKGNIISVKNPKSGMITADSIGEIIKENSVIETDCTINIR